MTKFFTGVLVVATLLVAQLVAQQPKIQQAPAQATSAVSGRQMFMSYCAVCHGRDGTGTGPAAATFKVPPADLTRLAESNKGTFPETHVTLVLSGNVATAHGSKDMPVWGPILTGRSNNDPEVKLRIFNLTAYLKSIQKK